MKHTTKYILAILMLLGSGGLPALSNRSVDFRIMDDGEQGSASCAGMDGAEKQWAHYEANPYSPNSNTFVPQNQLLSAHKVNEARVASTLATYPELKGQGTEQDPYQLVSVESIYKMREMVQTGTVKEKFWKLMNDVDFGNENPKEWVSIGTATQPFIGTFDGGGHQITVNIDASSQENVALFGIISRSTFKNLKVCGTINTAYKLAAGFCFNSDMSPIKFINCESAVVINSSVVGDGSHGGFIGEIHEYPTEFEDCVFSGKMIGKDTKLCGGFAGYSVGGPSFKRCLNVGTFDINISGCDCFVRGIMSQENVKDIFYLQDLIGNQCQAVQLTENHKGNTLESTLGDKYLYLEGKYPQLKTFGMREFLINGVQYSGLSNNELEVIACDGGYKGDVVISNELTIGGKVYTVTAIADQAFANCAELTSVTLPNGIKSIGKDAFLNSGLQKLIVNSDVPPVMTSTIADAAYPEGTLLVVPFERRSQYAAASYWQDLAKFPTEPVLVDGVYYMPISQTEAKVCPSPEQNGYYVTVKVKPSVTMGGEPYEVTTISEGAFQKGYKLRDIVLPGTLKVIEPNSFARTAVNTRVLFASDVVPQINSDFAASGLQAISNVQVPFGCGDAFRNDPFWGNAKAIDEVEVVGNFSFARIPGTEDEVGLFKILSTENELVLPSSITTFNGSKYRVTQLLRYSCSKENRCNKLTIPEGVKVINKYSFVASLFKTVILPSTLKEIHEGAFMGSKITDIKIPDAVEVIGYQAFYDCRALISVVLPASLKRLGHYAFFGAVKLENVDFSKAKSLVSLGGRTFDDTPYWRSKSPGYVYENDGQYLIGYSGNNTETDFVLPAKVKVMAGYLFARNTNLHTADLSQAQLSALGISTFDGCTTLSDVKLPATLDSLGNLAFYSCEALESIELPNGIKTIGDSAFMFCSLLNQINMPTELAELGNSVFTKDLKLIKPLGLGSKLTKIGKKVIFQTGLYNNTNAGKIIYDGQYVLGVRGLFSLDYEIRPGTTLIADNAFDFHVNNHPLNPISLRLPEGLTTIGDDVFRELDARELILPSTLKHIGKNLFTDCNIVSVRMPATIPDLDAVSASNLDLSSVQKIGIPHGKFQDYQKLPYMRDYVDKMEYATYVVDGINYMVYSSGTAEVANLANDRYYHYEGDLVIPDEVTIDGQKYPVTAIGDQAFENCQQLNSVLLPKGIVKIGNNAFNQSSVKYLRLSNGVPPKMESAFAAAKYPSSIILAVPSLSKYKYNLSSYWKEFTNKESSPYIVDNISYYPISENEVEVCKSDLAFTGKMVIPSHVEIEGKTYTVTRIGELAFENKNISSLILPETLTSVGVDGFRGLVNVPVMVASMVSPVVEDNPFATAMLWNNLLFAPFGSYQDYKKNEFWSTLKSGRADAELIGDFAYVRLQDTPDEVAVCGYYGPETPDVKVVPSTVTSFNGKTYRVTKVLKEDYPESKIYDKKFKGFSLAGKLQLPESVTVIGNEAFMDVKTLSEIILPEGLEMIQESAFSNCTNLYSVKFPSTLKYIHYNAFFNCSSLQNIDLGICDNLVQICSNAFGGTPLNGDFLYDASETVWLGISSLLSMPKDIVAPASLKFIADDIFYSDRIVSTIETIDLSQATNLRNVPKNFAYNNNFLRTVKFPNSLLRIGDAAFCRCTALTDVVFPDKLEIIERSAFEETGIQNNVVLPSSLRKIGATAFKKCSNLSEVHLPENLLSIGVGVFYETPFWDALPKEKEIYIGPYLMNSMDSQAQHVVVKEGTKVIADNVFHNFKGLQSVEIPEGVICIGSECFAYTSSLQSVTIPSTIQLIGDNTFIMSHLSEMKLDLQVPPVIHTEYNTMDHPGNTMTNVPLTVPSGAAEAYRKAPFWKHLLSINEGYFRVGEFAYEVMGDNKVQVSKIYPTSDEVVIPEYVSWNNQEYQVVKIKRDALIFKSLAKLTLPKSLTYIDRDAFVRSRISVLEVNYDNPPEMEVETFLTGLHDSTQVKVPFGESDKYRKVYFWSHFRFYLDELESDGLVFAPVAGKPGEVYVKKPVDVNMAEINIPANVVLGNEQKSFKVTAIGDSAFKDLSNLTKINIPEGITAIGRHAFYNCQTLSEVTLPKSLKILSAYAFAKTGLSKLTLPDNIEKVGANVLLMTPFWESQPSASIVSIGDCVLGSKDYNNGTVNEIEIPKGTRILADKAFCGFYIRGDLILPEELRIVGDSAFASGKVSSVILRSDHIKFGKLAFYGSHPDQIFVETEDLAVVDNKFTDIYDNTPTTFVPGGTLEDYEKSVFWNKSGVIKEMVFEVDGVAYSYNKGRQAKVMAKDGGYEGRLVVPQEVTYANQVYQVGGIDKNAFSGNAKLKEVVLDQHVTFIGANAFLNSGVERIFTLSVEAIPVTNDFFTTGIDGTKVKLVVPLGCLITYAKDVFWKNMSVTEGMSVGDFEYVFDDRVKNTLCVSAYKPTGVSIVEIPDQVTDENGQIRKVTALGEKLFDNNPTLTQVKLNASLNRIGDRAFRNCNQLNNVVFPANLKVIGEEAFLNCTALSSVDFKPVVRLDQIGQGAFDNTPITGVQGNKWCYDNSGRFLLAYNGPKYDLIHLSFYEKTWLIIDGLFANNFHLDNINFSEAVNMRRIPKKLCANSLGVDFIIYPPTLEEIGDSAFYKCGDYHELGLPEGVRAIGTNAFLETGHWNSAILSQETDSVYYGNYLLGMKKPITSEKVYKVRKGTEVIAANAFAGSSSLEKIVLPESIVGIGDDAFANCPNLGLIYLVSSKVKSDELYARPYRNSKFEQEELSRVVNVPVDACDDYKNSAFWTALGNVEGAERPFTIVDSDAHTDCVSGDIEGANIVYKRTFATDNWQGLFLPFEMEYADWENDFEIARINNVHQFDDDNDGVFERTLLEILVLPSGSRTEANVPYLIKPKNPTPGEVLFNLNNRTLYNYYHVPVDCSSVNTRYEFYGCPDVVAGSVMTEMGAYALSGGALVKAEGEGANLPPHRWYMKMIDRSDGEAPVRCNTIKLRVIYDDEVVGIEDLELGGNNNTQSLWPADVYDLSGKMIKAKANGPEELPRGVYIVKGKKFIK